MEKRTIFVKNYLTYCSVGFIRMKKLRNKKLKFQYLWTYKCQTFRQYKSTVSYEKIITILNEVKKL